jgi:molybdenum cofactor cytidylyltransferase
MITAIILAAGRSHRMGTPKALLPFAGSTVVECVVDAFLAAGVNHLIVVAQLGDQQLRNALVGRAVAFEENPDSAGDMLSSVRCGLRALPPAARVIAVSPVDQPSLQPELLRQMLTAFDSGNHAILVPVYQNRRGHPLIFSSRFRDELLTHFDGIGLRGLLQAHPSALAEWHTTDPSVLQDLDTLADYQAALKPPA